MDRAKPIVIHDTENKRDYTLEFSRDAVRFAEGRGFIIDDLDKFPMMKTPEFFWYAFRTHHPSVSLNQADKILEQIGGMTPEIAKRLGELWADTFRSLNDEERKNPNMTVEL